jgi:hypothetical protein
LPIDDGVLCVRRDIEPCRGQLCLPGGFHDFGETWQEAGAREVFEETGLRIDPAELREIRVLSPEPEAGMVLIFGQARPRSARDLPAFVPNGEATEMMVINQPIQLAFPLHTQVLAEYFQSPGGIAELSGRINHA